MIIERLRVVLSRYLGVDDHGGFLSLQYSVGYQRQLATDLRLSFVT